MNLDDLTGTAEQYSLSDLVPQSNVGLQLPSNAVKTRAAKTALLSSDPSKITEDYQAYVAEGEQGRSDAVKAAQERLFQAQQAKDMQGVMQVLADPNLTLDEKRTVIDNIRNIPKDTGAMLLSETLVKPSGGESLSQEEARMAAADWLGEINRQAVERQGIVNSHAASLDDSSGEAFVGMMEQWVAPFGNTADSFKLYKKYRELTGQKMTGWDAIKALALPGTNKAEIRDFLSSLPAAQRTEFTRQLIDVIRSNSGIVLNDNQFAQFEKADQLFVSGYSSLVEFLDNVTPLLDAIGVGQAMRAGARFLKGAKPEVKAAAAEARQVMPTKAPSPEDVAAPSPAPNKWFEELPPQPTEAPKPPGTADMPPKPKEGVSSLLGGTGSPAPAPQKQTAALFKAPEGVAPTSEKLLKTFDEIENSLIKEKESFIDKNKSQWTPLERAIYDSTASSVHAPSFDYTVNLLKIAKEHNRTDLIRYVLARARRYTESLGTVPGVPKTNPKFSQIEKDLQARKLAEEEALAKLEKEYAEELSGEVKVKENTPPPKEGGSVLLGGTGKKVVEEAPQKQVAALFRRIETNNTVAKENPTSAAKTVQQTNPESARTLHTAVAKSEDDAVATALYGTSRTDALASDTFPQAGVGDGRTTTRVPDIERNLRTELNIDEGLIDILYSNGRLDLTPAELARARAHVARDFSEVEGMHINDSMSSFEVDGGQVVIGAVYGTREGGFASAEQAISTARQALRSYGIRTDELTLLEKQGMDHVPVTMEEASGHRGNFLVRVDTRHDIDAFNLVDEAGNVNADFLDVKRNWLDRISNWIPLLQDPARHLFDAASMLHGTLTGAASVTTNLISRLDKYLLDLAADYSDKWDKLNKVDRAKVNEYIKEANYNRIAFDQTDLLARGFSTPMIDSVRAWRKFWDNHFFLENSDLVRTLNSEGYQLFQNATTTLYAKPIRKIFTIAGELDAAGQQVVGGKHVYNPASGTTTRLTRDEIQDIYDKGGYLARLRRTQDFGGIKTDMMIVRNTPTEFLRKFRDTDQVLNYINGYFQIQYKAPRFVDEFAPDGTRKAIAVAGDWVEAESFANGMRTQNPQNQYKVRGDERALQRGSDDWWDVNAATGRIAQRHRGKLLEDSSGINQLGNTNSYVLNPVDSAARAARSIAGRVITRPVLEQAKARAIKQYGHLFESDGMGGVKWPSSAKAIGQKGNFTTSELADARTTVNYINYLEHGYVNGIDNFVKANLNVISQTLGEKGFGKLERMVHLAAETQGGPIGFLRSSAAHMYLFWNPFRQLLVQGHQAIRAYGYNPIGMTTGRVQALTMSYINQKMGLPMNFTKEQKEFFKFVEDSGIITNIDRQNLVRGTLTDAAESTSRPVRIFGKASTVVRKVGFDTGETLNRTAHAAAVYEAFKRQGKNVGDKRVKAEMISKIDALGYDMNFAGDMPYNQTSASVMMQFMQVPHKAILQFSNRRLTRGERMRMGITDLILFGSPAAWVADMMGVDILPDDPDMRELVKDGAESMVLNSFFSWLSGEKTNVDFAGSFSPYNANGWKEFFKDMLSEGLSPAMLVNSPAGSIYLKDGGRVDNIITIGSRYFQGWYDDSIKAPEFLVLVNEVAKLSSGWSNFLKMKAALELKSHYEKYGLQAIDSNVNTVEAFAQFFGLSTQDVANYYEVSKKLRDNSQAHRDEVLQAYRDIKKLYAETEDSSVNRVQQISGAALKMFEDDPQALKIIADQLRRDLDDPEEKLLFMIMRGAGVPDPKNIRDQVLNAPISEENKQKALEFLDDTAKAAQETFKE